MFNQCCGMVHRIGPVYRFNSRKSSLYTDHRFSLCRSSSSHMEKKPRGNLLCGQAQRVWGRGGERRKQVRAVEEKTSVDRRTQTWFNSIQHHKAFRYSFSEAIPIFFYRIKSVFFPRPIAIQIFTSKWLWIEICENVVLSRIDITMTAINKKLWNW